MDNILSELMLGSSLPASIDWIKVKDVESINSFRSAALKDQGVVTPTLACFSHLIAHAEVTISFGGQFAVDAYIRYSFKDEHRENLSVAPNTVDDIIATIETSASGFFSLEDVPEKSLYIKVFSDEDLIDRMGTSVQYEFENMSSDEDALGYFRMDRRTADMAELIFKNKLNHTTPLEPALMALSEELGSKIKAASIALLQRN